MVNLAIIGMGNMGSKYAELVFKNEIGFKIVAVTRVRGENYERVKDYLSDVLIYDSDISLFNGYDSGEFKCDAVLIATPHMAHEYATLEAFKRKLNVLCDKPAAVKLSAGRLMRDMKPRDVKYGYVFHHRTFEINKYLKNIISTNKYGKVKRVSFTVTDWYRRDGYYKSNAWRAKYISDGGGVLTNQCPHSLDTLCNTFGLPKMLRAFVHEGKYHDIEVEDEVTAYMEWENGMSATFITSTGETPSINRMEIVTEKALITMYKDYITIKENEFNEEAYRHDMDLEIKACEERIDFSKNDAYVDVLKNFYSAVVNGDEVIADGDAALLSLYLANAMYLSGWKNKSVELYPIGSAKEKAFEEEFDKALEDKMV